MNRWQETGSHRSRLWQVNLTFVYMKTDALGIRFGMEWGNFYIVMLVSKIHALCVHIKQ